MKNYYAILGLPSTASAAEIDAAFRSLARKYHPDLRPDQEDAVAQFKLATEAHEVLSDAEKRRDYDRSQRPGRRVPISISTMPSPARSAKAKSHARPSLRSLDIEAELRLVPEEACRGGRMSLRVSSSMPCPACGEQSRTRCPNCDGEGTVADACLADLQLPPGLGDGDVLRVPGRGRREVLDGPRGDLYLVVRVRPCW